MAMIGLYNLIKNHRNIRRYFSLKTFTIVFFCFAGVFIVNRITSYNTHLWLAIGIGCVLVFWGIDAWFQQLSDHDLYGLPPFSLSRISGVFSDNAELCLIIPFLGAAITAFKERINVYNSVIFTRHGCRSL